MTKPWGYWTLENTLERFKKLTNQLGHPPTKQELYDLKKIDLAGAVQKHGGLNKIRKELGYKNPIKPMGYWTPKNTVKEYKDISDKLGHAATYTELRKLKGDLLGGIQRNGGIDKIRAIYLDKPYRKKRNPTKPAGYWTEERTIQDYKDLSDRLGHAATNTELRKRRSDLLSAIEKNGGMNRIRELAGYNNSKRPPKYWTEERTIQDYKDLSDRLGHAAKYGDIRESRCDLFGAIQKYGGMRKIREAAGYDNTTRQGGYWTQKNVVEEYKTVSEQLGHAATWNELAKIGRGDLSGGITRNGGIGKIRKLAGYDNSRKSDGYWTSKNTVKGYKDLSDKLGHAAKYGEIRELRRFDLLGAISKNGGLSKIQKLSFGKPCKKPVKKPGYWTEEKTVEGYKIVSDSLGYPLTQAEIMSLKRYDLMCAIQRNGGLIKIRALAFGRPYKSKKEKLENLIGEYILK